MPILPVWPNGSSPERHCHLLIWPNGQLVITNTTAVVHLYLRRPLTPPSWSAVKALPLSLLRFTQNSRRVKCPAISSKATDAAVVSYFSPVVDKLVGMPSLDEFFTQPGSRLTRKSGLEHFHIG